MIQAEAKMLQSDGFDTLRKGPAKDVMEVEIASSLGPPESRFGEGDKTVPLRLGDNSAAALAIPACWMGASRHDG
jgi:hypothetical protein